MSPPTAYCQHRMRARCETQAPCFDAHLNGVCENEDCAFDHGPLEEDLIKTLEWMGRSLPCREGSVCSNLACFLGHVCQDTDCDLFGGGTTCMLDSSLHFGGLSAHHFVPPATIDAHRGEYLWALPTGKFVPKKERYQHPLILGLASPEACPPENKKPNPLEWFKAQMNSLSPFPINKPSRHKSRRGSASSQASSTSKASQVSWDEDDEFDQVLKAMESDLDSHAAALEKVMPSVAAHVLGGGDRSRHRAEYNDLKKEIQRFKYAVAGYLGISDRERRMEAGSFSAEYRSLRGTSISSHSYGVQAPAHGLSYRRVLFSAPGPPSDFKFGPRRSDEGNPGGGPGV